MEEDDVFQDQVPNRYGKDHAANNILLHPLMTAMSSRSA